VLEAQALDCERGARVLFRGLSFAVGAGQSLRITGANGSGKTSLLRILCGLLPPTQGSVLWNGTSVLRMREEYSKKLVYLGHAAAVKDELSAAENLSIACRLAGDAASDAAVNEALARFGLVEESLAVKRLSQGQRRRAALARLALAEARPLWLLDEPFSALDTQGIAILNGLIRGHIGRGGALAFTTHQDPGIAATRVIELA
jgi:heme exporter protein A